MGPSPAAPPLPLLVPLVAPPLPVAPPEAPEPLAPEPVDVESELAPPELPPALVPPLSVVFALPPLALPPLAVPPLALLPALPPAPSSEKPLLLSEPPQACRNAMPVKRVPMTREVVVMRIDGFRGLRRDLAGLRIPHLWAAEALAMIPLPTCLRSGFQRA